MLKGKKILLGITGSIAAYKSILLVRLLIKAGAEVKIILTPSAKNFVSPLVLSTLSNNKVLVDMFEEDTWANHVMLGRWAHVMLIAPLSCNTLAKMANGQCDNLLLAVYLSATCPVIVSPAMDEDMWLHAATKRNIALLESFGNKIIDVQTGELASGLFGEGRMAEPEDIIKYIEENCFRTNELAGKKVLITAGPTYEALDPVRFIGNHSSGKMGYALAEAFFNKGAEVVLVSGPSNEKITYKGINITKVVSAQEMFEACNGKFDDVDIAVMSAAVADYKPASVENEKIKKKADDMSLQLVKTTDILKSLGLKKKNGQILVGFALETNNEKENALQKLSSKNADLIILNSLRDDRSGFGYDTNKVIALSKTGEEFDIPFASKKEVAEQIVNIIIQKMHV